MRLVASPMMSVLSFFLALVTSLSFGYLVDLLGDVLASWRHLLLVPREVNVPELVSGLAAVIGCQI